MELNPPILELVSAEVNRLGTKKAFADKVGTRPQTVGRWLSGETKSIEPHQGKGLARALGLSEAELYSLSLGQPAPDRTTSATDRHAPLANFLRSQPEANQDIIFKLAQSWGWEG